MQLFDLLQTAAAASVLVLLTIGLHSLKNQLNSQFHCC